ICSHVEEPLRWKGVGWQLELAECRGREPAPSETEGPEEDKARLQDEKTVLQEEKTSLEQQTNTAHKRASDAEAELKKHNQELQKASSALTEANESRQRENRSWEDRLKVARRMQEAPQTHSHCTSAVGILIRAINDKDIAADFDSGPLNAARLVCALEGL
ncbi:unnamed protein product, partial [Symbiodinium sp. KB8]